MVGHRKAADRGGHGVSRGTEEEPARGRIVVCRGTPSSGMTMRVSSLGACGFFTLAVLSLFVGESLSQADRGDSCKIGDTPGTCTFTKECPSVYRELLSGRPPRQFCGFKGFDPLICCPTEDNMVPTAPRDDTGIPVPFEDDGRGQIAKAQCAEYAKSVYKFITPPVLASTREKIKVSLCALKSRTLIVGGTKAYLKEFPHMAAVGYNKTDGIAWSCGGTLISEKFVLTAAHCTYSPDWGKAAWVLLGDLDLASDADDASPQQIKISQTIRHPQYRRPLEYHDIALLRLEENAHFNAFVRPACLPYSLPDIGAQNKAVATGWGHVEWAADAGSNELLKVTLKLVPQQSCNRTFFEDGFDHKLASGIVDKWQLCAGEPGKDTCQGDSGGPLAIFNSDQDCMYSVIGITSLGRICGSVTPGVYTRVYNYIPWIEQVVWPELASA